MPTKPTTSRVPLFKLLKETLRGSRYTLLEYLQENGASGDTVATADKLLHNGPIIGILHAETTSTDDAYMYSTLPSPSETVPGRLAYYATDDKFLKGIRTPIKVRKYLAKFPDLSKNPARLERVAQQIDAYLQPISNYDIRIFDSSDLDGWANAYYRNTNVRSCMSEHGMNGSTYGVGHHETYRCYCTAHYGLPDNGLKLVTLGQDDEVVARAITFEYDGQKCYVRHYGDSRIIQWLEANKYVIRPAYPHGLILVAIQIDEFTFIHPYVDGNRDHASHNYDEDAGMNYWELDGGDYRLSDADGVKRVGADNYFTCDHCEQEYDWEEARYIEDLDERAYTLCVSCYDEHAYSLDDGQPCYIPDIDDRLGGSISRHRDRGGFFTQRGMADNDYVILEGGTECVDLDDVVFVEERCAWHEPDDCVYVGDNPELGWEGDYVLIYAYQDGVILPYRESGYEGEPPLDEWRHCPDVISHLVVGGMPIHDDDTTLVWWHRPNVRPEPIRLPDVEAVETYPDLVAIADINYRYAQELGVWRNCP